MLRAMTKKILKLVKTHDTNLNKQINIEQRN